MKRLTKGADRLRDRGKTCATLASPSTEDARAAPRDRGIPCRDPALCVVTVGTMRGERCGLRDREKALCATLKVYLYRVNAKCLGCIQSEEERIESQ